MSTPIPLWQAFAAFLAVIAFSSAQEWFNGQYEITRKGPLPVITRRWYGKHAQVTLRNVPDGDDPDRFAVLAWDNEDSAVPWLKVHKLNPDYLTYWDEDSAAFSAPVTDFAPYAVRRFRPGVTFVRGIPVPWLWNYPVLPYPARVPQDVSEAA